VIRHLAASLLVDEVSVAPGELVRVVCEISAEADMALDDSSATDLPTTEVRHQSLGKPYHLSAREREVLVCVSQGLTDKEIAHAIGVTTSIVNKHLGAILGKMSATSRTEAGVRAITENLVSFDAISFPVPCAPNP
jgi:DNA-binding NarL/FixJ family response regulator